MGNVLEIGSGKPKPPEAPTMQLSEKDLIKCKECDGMLFVQTAMLLRVSPLQSPNGKAGVMPNPGPMVCFGCGNPLTQEDVEKIPTENSSGLLKGKEE